MNRDKKHMHTLHPLGKKEVMCSTDRKMLGSTGRITD